MEAAGYLLEGFAVLLNYENLIFALTGVVLGTLVGALPGFGPSAGIAILLPLVFILPPAGGLIMMGAIYYGAMYGNTISAVLLNMPGDAASVMTAIDGNKLTQKGRAGAALGIAAIASFIAGTTSVVLLTFVGPALADVAIRFGPAEYFGLMLVGLTAVAGLTGSAPVKGFVMAMLGLLLSMIGLDAVSYQHRLTFGSINLMSGIGFVPLIVGLFGLAQIFLNLEAPLQAGTLSAKSFWLRDVWPTAADWRQSWRPILRGTFIGFPVGVLPGAGASIATFLAYAYQKRRSKDPDAMGEGSIEGVAAPEAANNAAATGAFIPMLALGIPGSSTTAILLAAIIMWGMRPGPLLFQQRPEVLWPFVSSMYIGNVLLVIINLALIPLFVALLKASQNYLNAFIGVFAIVGVYSVNYNPFDVWVMIAFGVLGYILRKLDYPLPPLILAFVLGPMAEESLRQALAISGGSLMIFVARPISAFLLAIVVGILVVLPVVRWLRRRQSTPAAAS